MKNNNIMIILFVLLFFLLAGTVSASDNNTNECIEITDEINSVSISQDLQRFEYENTTNSHVTNEKTNMVESDNEIIKAHDVGDFEEINDLDGDDYKYVSKENLLINDEYSQTILSSTDSDLLSAQSTTISFDITEIWYGKATGNNTISGNVTSDSNLIGGGTVILKIDDDEYSPVDVTNGLWSVIINNTKYVPGNHSMTVTYSGYDDYSGSSISQNLTILTSESSGTSFSDLANYINSASAGDTLYLSHNYTRGSAGTITINKALTINGNCVTLDGSRARIILINGDNVTLNNINLTNGYLYNDKGAVYVNGMNVTFNNCNFINNNFQSDKDDRFGGAVYWYGNYGTLNNCTFKNTNAHGLRSSAAAICLDGNFITLNYCKFIDNQATGRYSRIAALLSNGYNNSFINCYFENNRAVGEKFKNDIFQSGGDNCSIINCTFYNNWVSNTILRISGNNVLFFNNTLNSNYGSNPFLVYCPIINSTFIEHNGGGDSLIPVTSISIINSSFIRNTGGASVVGTGSFNNQSILNCSFIGHSIYSIRNAANIIGCEFDSNSAAAIYLNQINYCNVSDCLFINNKNRYVYLDSNSNCTIMNCNFENNPLTSDGGIYFRGISCSVVNSNFTNNTVNNGVLYSDAYLKMINCSFINNTALSSGVIYSNSYLNVNGSKFINNSAQNLGGVIYSTNSLNVINSNFTINKATTGGAIYSTNSLNVNGCVFNNNSASQVGGAIYTSGSTNLNNSMFSHNEEKAKLSIDNNGVLISVTLKTSNNIHYSRVLTKSSSGVSVIFNNVSYWNGTEFVNSENIAPSVDGILGENITLKVFDSENVLLTTIYGLTNSNGEIDFDYINLSQVKNLKFNVCHDESDYYYENSTFDDNIGDFTRLQRIVDYYGSNAVINLTRDYTYSIGLDTITSGIVIGNNITINANGHTIDALGKSTIFNVHGENVTLKGIQFKNGNSTTVNGGAVNWQGKDGKLFNCSFNSNYANGKGDSVYWNGANGKLYNCTFINHQLTYTKDNLGVVYWNNDDGELYDCTFKDNTHTTTSHYKVSLIYSKGNNFIIDNCSFINNNMYSIYINSNNVTVINCKFTNNRKTYGVMFVSSLENISVINCNFNNNTRDLGGSTGGIIYVEPSGDDDKIINLTLENSTFTNNTVKYGGVLFTLYRCNITMLDCNFINNTAKDYMVGVCYLQGSGKIYNCNFTENKDNSVYGPLYLNFRWIVDDCNFINNTGQYTGAIYVNGRNNTISNSNFENNKAFNNNRGAIFVGSNGCLNVSNSSFKHNKEPATLTYINNGVNISIKLNTTWGIHYSRILSKSTSAVVNFDNVTYWNGTDLVNSDDINASAEGILGENITLKIYQGDNLLKTMSALTDENGTICFNYIDLSQTEGLTFTITHGVSDYFYGNLTFDDDIGDFTRLQRIVDFYGSNSVINLTRNYTYTVGLDDWIVDGVVINCTNVTINANGYTINAINKSRIFNISSDNVVLKNTTFTNATAKNGGAIFWNGDNGQVLNSNFINNTADVNGGAIYSNKLLKISDTNFYNNTAYSGSAIYTNGVINMTNVELLDNLANVSNILIKVGQVGRNVTVNLTLTVLDNFVNAIYVSGGAGVYYSNISYFEDGNVKVSDDTLRFAGKNYESDDIPFIHEGAFGENLTVYISNGTDTVLEYNITTNQWGNFSLEIYRLLIGNIHHNFRVVHNKNNYYNYYENDVDSFIERADPKLIVDGTFIDCGEIANITFSIEDDAHGKLVIRINDTVNYTFEDVNGFCNVSFENINIGMYNIVASYEGDENYTAVTSSNTLFVDRPATKLNITVEDIYIGGDVLFNFELKSVLGDESLNNASGIIRVIVGGKQYNITVNNGKSELSVNNLTIGKYDVIALYGGDINYKGCDGDVSFEVKGYETGLIITVDPSQIYVGDSFNVGVSLNDTIYNEPVYLYVDGELYNIGLTDGGVANFTVYDIKAGNHNFTAVFNDNGFFASVSNSSDVVIYKIKSNFDGEAIANNNREVNVTFTLPDDATGKVNITGVNVALVVNVTGGVQSIPVGVYNAGNYSFNISYSGDDKYCNESLVNVSVEVGKISDYIMNITSNAIVKTLNTTFTLNLPPEFKNNGTVTFIINNVTYKDVPVVNASASQLVTVEDDWTEINVTAVYSGFDNYASRKISKNFIIEPTALYDIVIKVKDNYYVGDNINITVEVPSKITKLNITVNDKKEEISRDNFTYYINDISEGDYTVFVSYAGDKDYAAKNNTASFKVIKQDPVIVIDNNKTVIYGDDEIINITLTEGVTGLVLINFDNKTYVYRTLMPDNNTVIFAGHEFGAGQHNVAITYYGDRKYNNASDSVVFTVNKYTPAIKVTGEDATYPNDITVTVVSDVSGEYNVSVGHLSQTVTLLANIAQKVTFNLPACETEYKINVTSKITDLNYTNSFNDTESVKVFKASSVITINPSNNVTYPDDIIFTYQTNSSVIKTNLTKDGVNVNAEITHIEAENTIAVSGLAAGNYILTVFVGDSNHNTANASVAFTVFKYTPVITVSVADAVYNGDVVVNVTSDMAGTCNVTVGTITREVELEAGVIKQVIFAGLAADETGYGITVSYKATENCTDAFNDEKSVIVYKASSGITVAGIVNGTYNTVAAAMTITPVNGSDVTFTISKDSIVIKEGKLDELDVVLAGLGAGDYTITVYNNDSENYTGSVDTAVFTVKKASSSITFKEFSNVAYGETLTIEYVIVNETEISAVIYSVDGSEVRSLGMGEFDDVSAVINALDAGDYYLEVMNGESENYTMAVGDAYFTVFKAVPHISVEVANVTYPGSVVIGVKSDVGGDYAIKVGDKVQDLVLSANETKTVTFDALDAGSYTVNVTYAETGNYNATYAGAEFSVFKASSNVEITSCENVTYPDVVEITYFVDNQTAVSVSVVDGDGVAVGYVINQDGAVVVSARPGNYTITIVNANTLNYEGSSVTLRFTVKKISDYNFNATSQNVTIKENASVEITLPGDASGNVSVIVDGKTYNVTVNDGKATVIVDLLPAGVYEANVVYDGDEIYTASNTTVCINVSKVDDYTMNATSDSPVHGQDATVVVDLPEDATGNVSVTVGNKTYNATVENGSATVSVPDLAVGDNNVNVTYTGDGNYTNKTVSLNIHVKDMIVVADPMTRGWMSGMDYRARLVDENNNPIVGATLRFSVDGYDYYAVTDADGYASIDAALDVGTYAVSVCELTSGMTASSQTTIVSRFGPHSDLDMFYLENKAYSVQIIGDDGKPVGAGVPVTITFNDVSRTVATDANGYAKLGGFTNAPGTYTISASYGGDDVSNNVKINTLFASKKTTKIQKSKINKRGYLVISYNVGKYLKGKKISLKFLGKTYKAKVSGKGKVQLKIPKKVINKLKVGKSYKYTLIYKLDKKDRHFKVYKKYLLFSSG